MRHPVARPRSRRSSFLLVLGLPFFRLVQGVPDASAYPAGLESRDAYVAIQSEFPKGETSPIVALVTVTGDPTSADNALAPRPLRAERSARSTGSTTSRAPTA